MRAYFSRSLILVVTVLGLLLMVGVQPVLAAEDIFTGGSTGVDCSRDDVKESAVCQEAGQSENPFTRPGGALEKVTNIIAIVAGAAAVIILIVGGIRYITSSGDANKVATAKNIVTNAIIGLVVIVVARSLVIYVVTKLVE